MITTDNVNILVISPTETDRAYMQDFFEHSGFKMPVFETGKFVPTDKYDFIVFDCRAIPVYKVEDFLALPEEVQGHFMLMERYITNSAKYILFFGKFYHQLNPERCIASNSKFTLYSRIMELIRFLNNFRSA